MSTTTLRVQALALAARLLSAVGAITPPVRITVECLGTRIKFTILDGELKAGPPSGLSPLERRVLAAATREPQTAKRLAAKVGREYTGHFRGALASLVRRGLLLHDHGSYYLPGE